MPSIVTITTYKHPEQNPSNVSAAQMPANLRHLFESKEKSEVDQTGTGFFVSKNGYIMTCLHLVKDAEKIQVTLYDKRKFSAQLVDSDSVSDLALLKIDGDNFSALSFESAKLPKVGSWVFVIGAPCNFDFSTNVGIISALNRRLPIKAGDYSIPHIQTSISINPGHSGGPVINLSGKVGGITTHIVKDHSSGGISFAVPALYAEELSRKWIYESRTKVGS